MQQQNKPQKIIKKIYSELKENSKKETEFTIQIKDNTTKIKPYLYIIELIVVVIVLIEFILKFQNISFSILFIEIPLILISICYFFLAFAKYETDIKPSFTILDFIKFILGWSKSTAIIGIVFALSEWPGADLLLTIGIITSGIVILVSLIFKLYGNKSEIFKISEIIRSFIILVLTLSAYYFMVLH